MTRRAKTPPTDAPAAPETPARRRRSRAAATPPDPQALDCPWWDLDAQGTGLSVDNFITSWTNTVAHALRRTVTMAYAEPFGMNVTEWRMLAFIAHEGRLLFSQLVQLSSTDKALVSRSLKQLEARGLVLLQASGRGRASRLLCRLSPAGLALHDRMIGVARERQAAMLRVLSPEERLGLYQSLRKLKAECARLDQTADSAARPPPEDRTSPMATGLSDR